ncbi:hypothetical protein C8R45DRAFT_1012983 [Mycena sanguinolenta]|nr:hypothetical protein C8R45DRAFT_1012983 [Mycena sanguinolenta]
MRMKKRESKNANDQLASTDEVAQERKEYDIYSTRTWDYSWYAVTAPKDGRLSRPLPSGNARANSPSIDFTHEASMPIHDGRTSQWRGARRTIKTMSSNRGRPSPEARRTLVAQRATSEPEAVRAFGHLFVLHLCSLRSAFPLLVPPWSSPAREARTRHARRRRTRHVHFLFHVQRHLHCARSVHVCYVLNRLIVDQRPRSSPSCTTRPAFTANGARRYGGHASRMHHSTEDIHVLVFTPISLKHTRTTTRTPHPRTQIPLPLSSLEHHDDQGRHERERKIQTSSAPHMVAEEHEAVPHSNARIRPPSTNRSVRRDCLYSTPPQNALVPARLHH